MWGYDGDDRWSGWPRFIEGGGVVVTYRAGEVYAERSYTSCTGNQAGSARLSARLQHLPPSLLTPARATRSDAVLMSTKKKVLEHTEGFCATCVQRARTRIMRAG